MALTAKGWTQQRIAKRLGMDQATVSRWLMQNGTNAEKHKDDARLPAKGEIEAIAAEIDAAARGVSQRKIAQRIGVPQQTITRWVTHSRMDAAAELDAIAQEIKEAARAAAEYNGTSAPRQSTGFRALPALLLGHVAAISMITLGVTLVT